MHVELLRRIFSALNLEASYVVLRNYDLLPDYYGNDVDILVSRDSYDRARCIIINECHAIDLKVLRITTRYAYTGIYVDLRGRELLIDLYCDLVKGWIQYANPQLVLENRIPYKGFYVPIVEHEAAIVACKDICAYGKIREKNLPLLQRAWQCDERIFASLIERYMQPGCPEKIYEAVSSANVTANLRIKFTSSAYFNIFAAVQWAFYRLRKS